MSVVSVQLERVTARAVSMLIARTVVTGELSALTLPEALALPHKSAEAAAWPEARFGVHLFINLSFQAHSLYPKALDSNIQSLP